MALVAHKLTRQVLCRTYGEDATSRICSERDIAVDSPLCQRFGVACEGSKIHMCSE